MGTKWFTGGVVAVSRGRIQFDFMFEGVRYRPSIQYPPSEAVSAAVRGAPLLGELWSRPEDRTSGLS